MLYQAGSRRNSSPTLEVGIFLLEKDKVTPIMLSKQKMREYTLLNIAI